MQRRNSSGVRKAGTATLMSGALANLCFFDVPVFFHPGGTAHTTLRREPPPVQNAHGAESRIPLAHNGADNGFLSVLYKERASVQVFSIESLFGLSFFTIYLSS